MGKQSAKNEDEKRFKAPNYPTEESMQLIKFVTQFRNMLENKKSNGITSADKAKVWKDIAVLFCAQSTTQRTDEQLQQKYESLKKEARKYNARRVQQRLQTGGGPQKPFVDNIIYEKILELIKLSAEGHPSQYDGDAVHMQQLNSTTGNIEPDSDSTDDVEGEALDESNSTSITVLYPCPDVQICEDAVLPMEQDIISWGKYTPTMLKAPKHPALQTVLAGLKEGDPLPGCSKDTTEFPVPTSVVVPSEPAQHKKQQIRNKRAERPLSASGQKLQPWVHKKTELVQLQMDLLKEKHAAEQQREKELFLLKKKDLQLSIAIKRENLRKLRLKKNKKTV